jgi:hypothetical protein
MCIVPVLRAPPATTSMPCLPVQGARIEVVSLAELQADQAKQREHQVLRNIALATENALCARRIPYTPPKPTDAADADGRGAVGESDQAPHPERGAVAEDAGVTAAQETAAAALVREFSVEGTTLQACADGSAVAMQQLAANCPDSALEVFKVCTVLNSMYQVQ